MKSNLLLSLTVLALTFPAASSLAADKHAGHGAAEKKATTPADAEIIAKARASYPLKTCLVSDEPLGSMGEAAGYVYRAAGQPDRVIFVCCEGCIDDFKAEPAKFLKKIDAAKAKSAPAK
jgi:hypothetical protein